MISSGCDIVVFGRFKDVRYKRLMRCVFKRNWQSLIILDGSGFYDSTRCWSHTCSFLLSELYTLHSAPKNMLNSVCRSSYLVLPWSSFTMKYRCVSRLCPILRRSIADSYFLGVLTLKSQGSFVF